MDKTNTSLNSLLQILENYLEKSAFQGFPDVLRNPALHIMHVKGKRIRPLLLLTTCQIYGADLAQALGPASAVELFHNFSLVHDDIIDEAEIRRGKPAVHIVFGTNKALLTGDALLIHSVKLLVQGPKGHLPELLEVFLKATSEVVEGEQYDVDFEDMNLVSEQEYMMMIEYKTSVLLAASLKMGAIIGGASMEDQELLYDFGLNLGLSFQIKDDFLDTYGDRETFGKKIGGDIVQNKKTYLLVTALEHASLDEKHLMYDLFNELDEDKKISRMIEMYDSLGVKEKTTDKMESLFQQAIASLDRVSLPGEAKKPLYDLANMVYNRKY
jgi:geranylgeranyl diphosphate synthase type II